MEYGTRDVGLETAAASNGDDESCRSRSRSRSSSSSSSSRNSEGSAATSDWPLESKLALAAAAAAGLGLQQPPSGAALLLNSLYSLHALHSGPRLWRGEAPGETSDGDEPKDPAQQEKEETSGTSELPMLNSWMLSAYASMLGRLSAVAACNAAAVLEPDCTDTESRSSDHSSAPQPDVNDFLRSRESSPSCSLQKQPQQSPAKRKRSRATTSTGTAKRARKKRTDEEQCKSEAPSSPGDETAGAASATTSTASAGKKRGLQALQRVRYRYEREEYRCGLCSYACTIEKAFERHLRDHARGQAQESRVSCAVCGADRSSELDLSKHMRRHRDNRYFCCDICIFRTVQLKKLIQHRRMHTGEKPHLCPHCSYRSARRDNLRSHVRRVHKKENLYQDTFSPRAPHFLKRQARSIVADVVVPLPGDESEAETEHPLEQSELQAPELKLESRPLEHPELQSESRVSDVEPEEIDSSDHALQPSPH